MDTRSKIVDWPAAAERLKRGVAAGGKVAVGYFDPLLAAHARRLRKTAGSGKISVVVTSPPRPILEAEARAVLVAALECVEMVTTLPADRLQELFAIVPEQAVESMQAGDARLAEEFMRRVQSRAAS